MRLLRDLGTFMRVRRVPFFRGSAKPAPITTNEDASLADLVSEGKTNGDTASDAPHDVIVESKPRREDPARVIQAISERFERHEGRSERIASSLDRVPDLAQVTMQAIPELTRNTAALLDAWESHATDAREQRQSIDSALTRLESVTTSHGQTLSLLQNQLVQTEHAMHRVAETIEDMRSTMRDLAGAHETTAELVRASMLQTEERERSMAASLGRCQKWMVVLAAMTAMASLGALGAAAIS